MYTQQKFLILTTLFISLVVLSSCLKDKCEETRRFVEFEQIYAHPDEFRSVEPSFRAERPLEAPGKIYYYENMLMINERYEGIHIFDNSVPESPTKMGFIHIPGNVDVAIKNNIMYADSYVDLLTIDVNDIRNPRLTCRDEEVFSAYDFVDERLGYYIGMRSLNRSVEVTCDDPNFGDQQFTRGDILFLEAGGLDDIAVPTTQANGGSGVDNSIIGVGGSFARFSVIGEHLYVINSRELVAYDISNQAKPRETETTHVTWNIETLFPYKQYLFIGANNGMYIYDRSEPEAPTYVSEFRHANACDPVFVKDDIAYVTLRNGTICQNFINQLEVIDVSNIRSPELIKSYEMDHPHGLTVRDNHLYICEGEHGLKVFENSDLKKIDDNRVHHNKNLHAYDAISLSSDHLLVIGDDGLYQYDSSDPSKLKEISFISSTSE